MLRMRGACIFVRIRIDERGNRSMVPGRDACMHVVRRAVGSTGMECIPFCTDEDIIQRSFTIPNSRVLLSALDDCCAVWLSTSSLLP